MGQPLTTAELEEMAESVVWNHARTSGRPGVPSLTEILVATARQRGTTLGDNQAWELIDAAMLRVSKQL